MLVRVLLTRVASADLGSRPQRNGNRCAFGVDEGNGVEEAKTHFLGKLQTRMFQPAVKNLKGSSGMRHVGDKPT